MQLEVLYRFIPMQDFSNDGDIDWSVSTEDIDKQLYEKYGLSNEEIDFINRKLKQCSLDLIKYNVICKSISILTRIS